MGLIRLLLLAFLAWLIWWLLRPLLRGESKPMKQNKSQSVENMVRCAHCGLNLPVQEAIREGERYYCSEEHRRLDQK
jgi:uncharacterized protein